ncbi:MAG TPA: hypothetical protein VHX61_02110 [Rhizomicrobium sp.]|jgi:hypothetical protein|nr:hypothetical protein [Rhizomicrobium sp.]
MKRLGILFALFAGLAIAVGLAFAQSTPLSFTCIAAEVGATTCPDGSTPLSAYVPPSPPATPPTYVTVAGYFQQSDAGGGQFYRIGSTPAVCKTITQIQTGIKGTVGSSTIQGIAATGLVVGELVGGSGSDTTGTIQIQPGTEIASIYEEDETYYVTLTLPLTGTATDKNTSFASVTFTGDNTGTLIVDAGGDCWQKTNYRGDPHEFGAWGDGASSTPHDDTAALQNWFGAYGNVNPNLAPATAPNAFGPWIATVPATYIVNTPLTCPQNATVQGTVNLTNSNPVVAIEAASGQTLAGTGSQDWFSGTLPANETASSSGPISAQAVIGALAYCRLTGISVVGNGYYLPTIMGTISNGSNCITAVIATLDLEVGNYVAGSNIPPQTTVTAIGECAGTPSVTLSNAISCTSCGTEAITFYGPDVVDVLAQRVAVDGFSALSNGGNNLVCINTAASGYGLQVKNTEISGAMNDDIHAKSGCPNVRFIGDIVSGAGKGAGTGSVVVPIQFTQVCGPGSPTCTGTGFYWSGVEMTIADGVIEESQGIGLDLDGARKVSVSAMDIQGNGLGPNGGTGITIGGNSSVISICDNHISGVAGPSTLRRAARDRMA